MRLPTVIPLCVLLLCGHLHGQPTTISGKVLDPDGKPAAGATVYLIGWEKDRGYVPLGQTQTTADGSFAFAEVKLGSSAEILALKDGYGFQTTTLTKERTTGLVICLRRGGEIAGQVRDRAGKAIEGVNVCVVSEADQSPGEPRGWSVMVFAPRPLKVGAISATTGVDGKFRIGVLPDDKWFALRTHHPSYADWAHPGVHVGWKDIKVWLVPAGRIRGRVVFGDAGTPAPGIKVTCYQLVRREEAAPGWAPPGGKATTDEKGCFTLDNLWPGNYSVGVERMQGDTETRWLVPQRRVENLAEGQDVMCEDLILTQGGLVTGKVTDLETDQPIAGASLTAFPPEPIRSFSVSWARTQSDGSYKLRLPPGRWRVHASGEGHIILSSPPGSPDGSRMVDVAVGVTTEGVDFALVREKDKRERRP